MDNLKLEVEPRQETGTKAARRLRREGKVPGVVYGIQDSSPVTVNPSELEKIFSSGAGTNAIIQLDVAGQEKAVRPVIVKELQRDAMSDLIVHADFLEIRMDEKIRVSVPLILEGESPGVKLGGVLSTLLRELEIECLPNAIPSEIMVDISAVEIGDVIHVRDLTLPGDVGLITEADDPIFTVITPVEEEEETPEEGEEGEDAEGAAPEGAEGAEAAAAPEDGEKSGD
ncbi:MAG: 50S ribosomal protein L25 [Nitrospinaceae bacterium]|nr:50S ribosomal protein L25 [Nitrospinaceae bacterium]MBT3434201.1 50S ribosomal protein L25 [Nitrospinaceae bacterium]MBT3820045.1 50S ribosomal protein L25 [Nitrospinaceae bacterium]MBT4094841.1 50S ribosomal protein L25 [Nitrospinaceae bacterium]MBT4431877.1 50S ribosomal protein L25 [Nitrospinaceae bacterium]